MRNGFWNNWRFKRILKAGSSRNRASSDSKEEFGWVGGTQIQQKIIQAFHDSPMGGHSGFPVTYRRIRCLFAWKKNESTDPALRPLLPGVPTGQARPLGSTRVAPSPAYSNITLGDDLNGFRG